MNKKLLLLLITGICILIWLVNNFSSRLNSLEERVLLNNNMIGEVYNILQKQDTMVGDIEDNLASWIERELGKIHLRINKLPMEN